MAGHMSQCTIAPWLIDSDVCQIIFFDGPLYTALQVRGEHNADSHSPDKERSKHLTVKQIHAIATGVRMAPNQSARTLWRNLTNFDEGVQIDPVKTRNLRHKVARIHAKITFKKLDQFKMDDSFGTLTRYSEAKLFKTLFQ